MAFTAIDSRKGISLADKWWFKKGLIFYQFCYNVSQHIYMLVARRLSGYIAKPPIEIHKVCKPSGRR